MAEPVIIKAEPATMQVRTAAMASASRDEHALVIGQDTDEFHFSCSCGQFSGSHHTDQSRIRELHAAHVTKKRVNHG